MRFFGKPASDADESSNPLVPVVRQHLPSADQATVEIVAAIAGLLAGVAYADHEVSPDEERQLRAELGRIHDLGATGVDAIVDALHTDLVGITSNFLQRFTRTLKEHGDRDLRLEVLGVLVDLAAADGQITLDEVSLLRRTATAMGLSQDDYNDLQAKHRDKLSFLS